MFRFEFPGAHRRLCNGLTRRQTLQLGATGMFAGLTLPGLLRAEEVAKTDGERRNVKAKSCIFIFLEGGPPQQDMWDPKPDAPAEIRGPFQTITTKSPGVIFTEHCRDTTSISSTKLSSNRTSTINTTIGSITGDRKSVV